MDGFWRLPMLFGNKFEQTGLVWVVLALLGWYRSEPHVRKLHPAKSPKPPIASEQKSGHFSLPFLEKLEKQIAAVPAAQIGPQNAIAPIPSQSPGLTAQLETTPHLTPVIASASPQEKPKKEKSSSWFRSSSPFHGFYIGQGLGLAINTAKIKTAQSARFSDGATTPFNDQSFSSSKLFRNHIYGTVFAGGSVQWKFGLNMGLRAGVNVSRYRITQRNSIDRSLPNASPISLEQNTKAKMRLNAFEYTADGTIGWLFRKQTLIFGFGGVGFNRTTLHASTASNYLEMTGGAATAQVQQKLSKKNSDSVMRYRWGAGVEQLLSDWIGIETLYTYTNYGTLREDMAGSMAVQADTIRQVYRVHARYRRQIVTASLVFHF